jgi:hypothetical protein
MTSPPDPAPPGSASPAPPEPPPATIHEAELGSGATGAVIRGAEIDFETAVARRRRGENVVVCGDDIDANRRLAQQIESAVGPCTRSAPHRRYAGPRALPHFQPRDPDREGHTFYETPNLRASRRKR